MQRLSVFFTAMIFGAAAWAQEPLLEEELFEDELPEIRRYSVEVIVFAYNEEVSVGTEVFVPEVGEYPSFELLDFPGLDEEGAIPDDSVPTYVEVTTDVDETEEPEELDEADEAFFEMLLHSEDELMLTGTVDRLDRLDAYEPLLHIGWTQTALAEADTPALDLREFGEPPERLSGSLTLYLSRYLHLVVDLELDADLDEDSMQDIAADLDAPIVRYDDSRTQNDYDSILFDAGPAYGRLSYRINENRLFKNGETRYYDHPKFGVIAKVVRVEQEEEELFRDDTEFLLPAPVSE
jgi:hypothetical protein